MFKLLFYVFGNIVTILSQFSTIICTTRDWSTTDAIKQSFLKIKI